MSDFVKTVAVVTAGVVVGTLAYKVVDDMLTENPNKQHDKAASSRVGVLLLLAAGGAGYMLAKGDESRRLG